MPTKKRIIRQRDFTGGELVEHSKRRDDSPLHRSGARVMSDWRLLAPGAIEQRPGRRSLFLDPGRNDDVRMSSMVKYRFCFGQGTLRIRDSNGVLVAAQGGYGWTLATADQITWERVSNTQVVICFPGMKPKVCTWDGANAWAFTDFAFYVDLQGLTRQPYYRYATPGVTMKPSALTGNITILFSDDVLNAAHVGVIFRYAEKQIRITLVTDARNANATVIQLLPPTINVNFSNDADAAGFYIGDIAVGSVTETRGIITFVNAAVGADPNLRILTFNRFVSNPLDNTESLVGPTGKTVAGGGLGGWNQSFATPAATTFWDEAAFSDYRGWPGSCFFDNNRFGMCDMTPIPDGIAWSLIGQYNEFFPGFNPDEAIFELVPGKPRVYHVVAGDDQFVFTSKGIFYVPISESNPLKPGSVAFRSITRTKASQVRPAVADNGVLFVNAARKAVSAIVSTGQVAKPYIVRDVSQYHSHLFTAPKCIAATTGDGIFPEPYVFVLNDDGSLAVGKYYIAKEWVGWVPWNRASTAQGAMLRGTIQWIGAYDGDVLFTTLYQPGGGVNTYIAEIMDSAAYLDANVPINAVPPPMQPQTEAEFQILPEAGTHIGDMLAVGGLAAAHDRITAQTAAQAASRAAASGFFGSLLSVALPAGKVELWPSSDQGYVVGGAGNVTLDYRASNVAPNADGSNGTLLGTANFADELTGPRTINSNDAITAWLYRWVRITQGGATNIYLAEAKFYHAVRLLQTAGGGTGALWWLPGATVKLMDGLRVIGNRAISSTGAVVPIQGEDLSAATIVAGFFLEPRLIPFVPHVNEGDALGQTFVRRQIAQAAVAVQKSTGFTFVNRAVAPYRTGENQALPPPQREEVQIFTSLGSDYDPQPELVKNTPGTLRVLEISLEIPV